MINETDLVFTDISSEESRTYVFPSVGGTIEINITDPIWLNVSASGGHRILDADGISYYVKPGWILLEWRAKSGKPNFVK